jgi:hypothetical protein
MLQASQTTLIAAVLNHKVFQQTEACAYIQADERLTAQQRLGIYRHSVQAILSQHLSDLFPVVKQLVGDDFFEDCCSQLIDAQPPTQAYLAAYGAEFANQLRQHPALASMDWMAEVAQLEWARHQAWHTANQASTQFTDLMQLSASQQAQTRLQLPQSAHLIQSPYALHNIWLAHQPQQTSISVKHIQLHEPSYLIVWRAARFIYQSPLNELMFHLLSSIQAGKTLGDLTQQFTQALPALLQEVCQQGWLLTFNSEAQS